MNNVKKYLKITMGYVRCKIKKITYASGIYIGKGTKLLKGNRIKVGKNAQIRSGVHIYPLDLVEIGQGTDIGERNRIVGNVILGSNVLLGPSNHVGSETHNYENIDVPIILQGAHNVEKQGHKELIIGDGTWIGTHCAIIGCVHIGKNCVIGANSVVTKDVPDYSVVVGNPARIVKRYNLETGLWEKIEY